MPRSPRISVLLLAVLLIVTLKFALVYGRDVHAAKSDAHTYLIMGKNAVWSAPYTRDAYSRPPTYPLFLTLSSRAGVPARLSIELLWLIASGLVAVGLHALGASRATCLAACALCAFHPMAIDVMSRTVCDGFYAACLLMLVTALAVLALVRDTSCIARVFWRTLAIMAAALAYTTRPESVLIVLALVCALVIAAIVHRSLRRQPLITTASAEHEAGEECAEVGKNRAAGGPAGYWWRPHALWLVLVPLAACFALHHTYCALNARAMGLYAPSDLASPGFAALYRALLSIPPASPDPRVPIPREVRLRAYAASPAFAQLRPYIDGPGDHPHPTPERPLPITMLAREFQKHYKLAPGQPGYGEYGHWVFWAIKKAAWDDRFARERTRWGSASQLDAFYAQAAREITQAQARGELARRPTVSSFFPPEWRGVLARVPGSLLRLVRVGMTARVGRAADDASKPHLAKDFDAIAHRRPWAVAINHLPEPARPAWARASDRIIAAIGATQGATVALALGASVLAIGVRAALSVLTFTSVPRLLGPTPLGDRLLGFTLLCVLVVCARAGMLALLDAAGVPPTQRYLLPATCVLVMGGVAAASAMVEMVRARGRARGRA